MTLAMATLVAFGTLSASWTLISLVSMLWTVRHSRSRQVSGAGDARSVSILKPLAGFDPALGDNLRTFFELHGNFELLFGTEQPSRELRQMIAALSAEFPHVSARLIEHAGGDATNPKVRNLMGILPHAEHAWVLVSDSNVAAPRGYLLDALETQARTGAGLVTHAFSAAGETSVAAMIEATQLNGFNALGCNLPMALGDAAVIGKSILMNKHELAQLGGLERVANVLAEDFFLGKMYEHAGKRVALGRAVPVNVLGAPSLKAVFNRHRRWATMRYRLRTAAYLLEPLSSGLSLSLLAWVLSGWSAWPCMLAGAAISVVRDVGGWLLLRGTDRVWIPIVMLLPKELVMFAAWLSAPFQRHMDWRGVSLRLGAGSFLFRTEVEEQSTEHMHLKKC
jgi:ceramide glucosyltransferase